MISIMTTLIIFALIIGVVIIIHEVGHFVAAKLVDMMVEEFCFGFGPRVFSKKYGETEYIVRIFPIGGYVKILGEEGAVKDKRSFSEKSVPSRMFVALAGILMNVVLSISMFYVVLGANDFVYDEGIPYYEDFEVWFGEQESVYIYPVTVLGIVDDGCADKAGLEAPFEIISVDDTVVESIDDLKSELTGKKESEIVLEISRGDGDVEKVGVGINEDGMIGVELASDVRIWTIKYEGWDRYLGGFAHFANMVKANGFVLGQLFNQSVENRSIEPVAQTVSGPIGLIFVVDIVKKFVGVLGLLNLLANLNLILAVINILPFPALDGGQSLFLIIEAIRRKPLNKKVERLLVNFGMMALFTFMIVVSVKDFFQFGIWTWICDGVSSLFG